MVSKKITIRCEGCNTANIVPHKNFSYVERGYDTLYNPTKELKKIYYCNQCGKIVADEDDIRKWRING